MPKSVLVVLIEFLPKTRRPIIFINPHWDLMKLKIVDLYSQLNHFIGQWLMVGVSVGILQGYKFRLILSVGGNWVAVLLLSLLFPLENAAPGGAEGEMS